MESISKTPVDVETARRIVADAFGSEVRLVELRELTEGWFNSAHALVLSDERTVVLKVAPPPDVAVLSYERDIIRAEAEALALVRRHTDAPVPTVLRFDDRCRFVPSPYLLMTFVPGVSLHSARDSVSPGERAVIDASLGRHLRDVNAIVGASFGLLAPGAFRDRSWRVAFTALFEALLHDGERAGVDLPVAYDVLRSMPSAARAALDEVTEPRLVLWDLWDGNVQIDAESHALTGLLDFERALWGDPLMEVQFGERGGSAHLLTAYGRAMPDDPGGLQRRALYTLYLHLVMSIEGTYRQYPADPLGEWARGQLALDVERVMTFAPPAS